MDRKRVLLAEDDPDTRFLLAMVLSEHGYDVIAAPDGVEALALAERQAPDLMVVDQMMPRMTGTDCLSVMRAHPLLRTVPTVMVTRPPASSKGLNRFASMPWSRSRWNWKVSFGRCARCARLAPSERMRRGPICDRSPPATGLERASCDISGSRSERRRRVSVEGY